MINQCIRASINLEQLKLSHVKPLKKRGDKTQFKSYRPIALLPSLSKIFERVIFYQLLANYLSNNNLRWINRFGSRPGHSTELAALRLVDHLIVQMDRYNVHINVFIDLSKAFNTLDHSILLYKLKYYDVTGCSYGLLSRYLTNRSQYVKFSGHMSDTRRMSTGVPHGSVLCPLLFLNYINDLTRVSNTFDMIMYADDIIL